MWLGRKVRSIKSLNGRRTFLRTVDDSWQAIGVTFQESTQSGNDDDEDDDDGNDNNNNSNNNCVVLDILIEMLMNLSLLALILVG